MSSTKAKADFKSLSSKGSAQKKIDSPFAKYNSIGQLTCVVCNQVVKSELLWNAHLSSKTHAENKNKLKIKLMSEAAPKSTHEPVVSKTTETLIVSQEHKSKSVVSNESNVTTKRSIESDQTLKTDEDEVVKIKKQKLDKQDKVDTFKKPSLVEFNKLKEELKNEERKEVVEMVETDSSSTSTINTATTTTTTTTTTVLATNLPEGFFDDPDLDAKIRGVSRAENLEAEYEEFKKQIQSEEFKSDVLIEKEDTLRDLSRDLDEVDELIHRWTKIEHLHQKREEMINRHKESKMETEAGRGKKMEEGSEESSDESDVDLENILNLELRSKKRF